MPLRRDFLSLASDFLSLARGKAPAAEGQKVELDGRKFSAVWPIRESSATGSEVGDGSQAFCRTGYDAARKNAGLLPRDFDMGEMGRDLASHDALGERLVVLENLMERVRDTDTALGSDVMASSLEAYAHLKVSGRAEGVDGLKRLLARRFQGQGRKEDPAKV